MGFFSSIGGILGGVGGFLLGGPAGAVVGSGLGGAVGGGIDSNSANNKAEGYYNQQMSFAQQQAQFQQDYVKNMMQWRVEDAKNAGVHPMAALGVSNPSYSPVSAPSAPEIYNSGQFDTGSTFGQSLNRASFEAKNQAQQAHAARLGFQQIELQNQGLSYDNQYKALQVAQLASELQRNAASSAPLPGAKVLIDGQAEANTGLVTPEGSATHIWDMGHGNYSILWNPDYTQSIGDEAGQVFNIAEASKKAYKDGTFIDPESGVTYVYNQDSGWWNRLDSLSDEEARRLLGSVPTRVSGPSASHRVRNAYRYR